MAHSSRLLVGVVLAFTFGFTPLALAQGTTGSINGTVQDNTGAFLPGVTITASGPAIMGVQTGVTNAQGQYRFPALPPGTYQLRYELSGFSAFVRDGIAVSVGFAATIDVQLKLATLAETVTVTGQSPVVESEQLDPEDAARERLVFALRRLEGIDVNDFAAATGFIVEQLGGEELPRLIDLGLLNLTAGRLKLTRRGLLVSDAIWPEFLRA